LGIWLKKGARLAAGAGRYGEGVEIAAPKVWGRAETVVPVEVVGENLAYAGDFSEPSAVLRIRQRQVEQLERSVNCSRAVLDIASLLPGQSPGDFAADVSQLLCKAEFEPSAGSQIFVPERHRITRRPTVSTIFLRT